MSGFPSAFVAAARSYIGVPWKHQGRSRAAGVDCIGLVVMAARDCGLELPLKVDYGRTQAYWQLRPDLKAWCTRLGTAEAGAVVLYKTDTHLHVAVWTGEGTVVQALAVTGRVVESGANFPLLQAWRLKWPS